MEAELSQLGKDEVAVPLTTVPKTKSVSTASHVKIPSVTADKINVTAMFSNLFAY